MKQSSFFKKLFTGFVLLVLSYTMVSAVFLLYKNNQIVGIELQKQREVFLKQNRDAGDNKIKTVMNIIGQLRNNRYVLEFARESVTDYYNVTSVYNELSNHISSFSEAGFRIDIKKNNVDFVITPTETMTWEQYQQMVSFSRLEEVRFNLGYPAPEDSAYYAMVPKSTEDIKNLEYSVLLVKKEELAKDSQMLFLVRFYKNSLLLEQDNYASTSAFGIVKEGKLVALNATPDEPSLQAQTTDWDNYVNGLPADMRVYMLPSKALSGWNYFYISREHTLYNRLKSSLPAILVICFTLFICGGIASYMLSKSMYNPIRKLVGTFTGMGLQGSRDEMAFISETAQQMKATNDELAEKLENYQVSLKDKFWWELLYGLLTKEQIEEGMRKFSFSDFSEGAFVAIVEIRNSRELIKSYSKEILFTLKAQTQELMLRHVAPTDVCAFVDIDVNRYAVVFQNRSEEEFVQALTLTLTDVEEEMFPQWKCYIRAATGCKATSFYDADAAFQAALEVLEYTSYVGQQSLFQYNELQQRQLSKNYYPLEWERELMNFILENRTEEAYALVNKIVQENFRNRQLDKGEFIRLSFSITATLTRILQKLDIEDDDLLSFQSIVNADGEEPMRDILLNWVDTIQHHIHKKRESLDQNLVQKIVEFIKNNYTRDISLTEIAEAFRYSPSHVSTAFKQFTGENFKDYLNSYRVEQAKKLLDETDIKIGDLALHVGCNNANTFIRIFRKYEGISPGQYARRSKSGDFPPFDL